MKSKGINRLHGVNAICGKKVLAYKVAKLSQNQNNQWKIAKGL